MDGPHCPRQEPVTLPFPRKRYPLLAGAGRRVFHTLLAGLGWALFAYWWWIVFSRVSVAEVRFTLVFIGVATAVIVLLTIAWVLHNKHINDRRPARLRVRGPAHMISHDSIGRELRMLEVLTEYQRAVRVRVQLEGGAKVYRCDAALGDTDPPGSSEAAS